jgi:hypothetical protein
MIKTISAIAMLLTLVSVVVAQEHTNSSWVKLAPENGGFTAMMPSKPEEQLTTKEPGHNSCLHREAR